MALIIATAVVVALAITPEVDHVADARRGPGVTAIAHEFLPRYSALQGAATMQPLQAPRYADGASGLDPSDVPLGEPAELLEPQERVALLPSLRPPAAQRVVAAGSGTGVDRGRFLASLAACESGGNYAINTGNGYYGAYQFDLGTWAGVGGSGRASDAAPEEQDARALALFDLRGVAPWPYCGPRALAAAS